MIGPLKLRALSADRVEQLARALSGAVIAEGGWVQSRTLSDDGVMLISFEFERRACVEMYTLLIAAGLVLSADSHWKLNELCHCTRHMGAGIAAELVGVDLVVQAERDAPHPLGLPLGGSRPV